MVVTDNGDQDSVHSVREGGGVERPTKFSIKGGLFQWGRGLQFLHKNKLKSEIFNGK